MYNIINCLLTLYFVFIIIIRMRKPKITEAQKVFAKEYVESGDLKSSVQTAFPNNKAIQDGRQSVAYARRILRSKPVKNEISHILDKAGLTKNTLSRELFDVLTGTFEDDTRLKAVRMGFELHGAFEQERETTIDDAEIFADITPEAKDGLVRELIARISAKSGGV